MRLSAKGEDKAVLEETLASKIEELSNIIPDVITGFDEGQTIEKRVGHLLKKQGKTIATAESLTGGKIAAKLVSISGASAYFKGSIVSYTEEIKVNLLDVPKTLIEEHTVVSEAVASQMAISARKKLGTDLAIAVTGNAGPTTDNNNKAVGLVYIALASEKGVAVAEFNFGKPREKVIERTVNKSLEIVLKNLLKKE